MGCRENVDSAEVRRGANDAALLSLKYSNFRPFFKAPNTAAGGFFRGIFEPGGAAKANTCKDARLQR
jgi:hypothetical protein